MTTAPATIWDLARRLIVLEAARDELSASHAGGAGRVCDRLRVPLARLAGVAGFHSLLSRALALAKAEVVSLEPVRVREDGSLEGLDGTGHGPGAGPGGDAGAVIVAHLLGLLVTFIGEPLIRQLVRDTWPDADETDGTPIARPILTRPFCDGLLTRGQHEQQEEPRLGTGSARQPPAWRPCGRAGATG